MESAQRKSSGETAKAAFTLGVESESGIISPENSVM